MDTSWRASGDFFSKEDTYIRCEVCPNRCKLTEGKSGICRVRFSDGDTLRIPYYGKLSSLAVDPIEKKPLYHFYPGQSILSAGFWGCSFRCPFCQNWNISQTANENSEYISPEKLVSLAEENGSFGIAYTYSEPTVHIEYLIDTSKIARSREIKNVLVSNGYLNPESGNALLEHLDAANIDLKSFNPDFYKKEIKGKLQPVLDFITQAAKKIHLEVTTLIIPGKNDSPEEMRDIASFLAELDKDIPLHLSAYYPCYHYSIPATGSRSLLKLLDVAREYLNYVFPGNIMADGSTLCPDCGHNVIKRMGYRIDMAGFENGACKKCGKILPIKF